YPHMTNGASATGTYPVPQNDDVARLRRLYTICLDVVSEFLRPRSVSDGNISNSERPNEVTSPQPEHRSEYVSAAGHRMSTRILFLFRLLAACFCPASLCHKI